MKTKILSSISGRIRIKVVGLLYNENAIDCLKKSFHLNPGIILVSPNKFTGNMLIYYDVELIDIFEILRRISSISIINSSRYVHKDCIKKLQKTNKIYNDELSLSRRLQTLSFIISGLALFISFDLDVALSVIILGSPGILFLIRRSVYSITQKILRQNNFDFKNLNLLFRLSEVEHILIEDSILSSGGNTNYYKNFTSLHYDNAIHLIKEFRNFGLTDIAMISRENRHINDYLCHQFGINKIELGTNFSYNNSILKNLLGNDKTIAIVKNNDLKKLRKQQIIVFLGYQKLRPDTDDFIVAFKLAGVNKIPYVIEASKYCNKLAIRSENIAITVNIIGIFLASTKFITPLSSIALYFTNYFINKNYITTQLTQHEKEHLQ